MALRNTLTVVALTVGLASGCGTFGTATNSPNADASSAPTATPTDTGPVTPDPVDATPTADPTAADPTPADPATSTPEPTADPTTGPTGDPTPAPQTPQTPVDPPAPVGGTGTMALGTAPTMQKFHYDLAAATADFESRVGTMTARREYRQWGQDWAAGLGDDAARGRTAIVSVKPPTSGAAGWREIASGADDDTIRRQAARLASFGAPVYLTFNHEPEDDAPTQSAAFRLADEHFYDVAKAAAPSLNIGPILMVYTTTPRSGRTLSDWLPADDKMDFIGWDGYNFYSPELGNNRWVSPAELFDPALAAGDAHGKPNLIAETGVDPSVTGPAGQSPASWLAELINYSRSNGVRALTYFNTGVLSGDSTCVMDDAMESVYRQALGGS